MVSFFMTRQKPCPFRGMGGSHNTGSFEKDNATEKEITDSMNKRIENKDYESYVI